MTAQVSLRIQGSDGNDFNVSTELTDNQTDILHTFMLACLVGKVLPLEQAPVDINYIDALEQCVKNFTAFYNTELGWEAFREEFNLNKPTDSASANNAKSIHDMLEGVKAKYPSLSNLLAD